jgi:hypothetical protein
MDKNTNYLLNEIAQRQNQLRATDYQAIKFAEGEMSAEEFMPVKLQRKEWRAQINALQEELQQAKQTEAL